MTKLATCVAALAIGLCALPFTLAAPQTGPAAVASKVVLGTFDSRVVAIAYYRSDLFRDFMARITKQHQEAKAAGDEETARDLEERMAEKQKHIHQQGFGNAPIPKVLELLKDKLPGIASRSKVDAIVSKWDLVYSSPSCTFVDLSLILAEEFHPDAKTLEVLKKTLEVDPIPNEQLDHDDD